MFPLKDNIPSKSFPIVTIGIIFLNCIFFWIELMQGDHIQQFVFNYGIVPVRITDPLVSEYFTLGETAFPILTSIFLHGGWFHLLTNMWFLWLFGDNVEDRMGHVRYLVFYMACGIVAGLVHVMVNSGSQIPSVGASGAIAGVMAAYLMFFPFARIIVLVPLLFVPFFFELYAVFFIGLWFFMQLQFGSIMLFSNLHEATGIAWWAHLGGFWFGFIAAPLVTIGKYRRKQYDDDISHGK